MKNEGNAGTVMNDILLTILHVQDEYNYDQDDGGDEEIIDFKRGPGQKGISKVDSNDLTQLGLIQTAEDQKTRDNGN